MPYLRPIVALLLLTLPLSAQDDGKYLRDLVLADRAIAERPTDADAYRRRAELNEQLRYFDKAVADYTHVLRLDPADAGAYQSRGSAHFRLGHITESLADFDKYLELRPAEKPHHWQRGIALYYAGRFEEGAKQFEIHRTVNPDDVENAAWHYLCVARTQGVEKARAALIPIERDDRVPMMQVHALYAGKLNPADVLAAATKGNASENVLRLRHFYAHLYLGLYHEVAGDKERAREHILLAAEKYAGTDYMGDVARVHAARLPRTP